jgi:DNA-binding GntR family transcriptional regulator
MASNVRVKAVKIDPQSPEHPYQQLARQLRQQIETGKIVSQLPSSPR